MMESTSISFKNLHDRLGSLRGYLYKTIKYSFPIILMASILFGGLTGLMLEEKAQILKPLGDIFLNLIFTAIVPLIFFSVASAIARAGSLVKLGKIIFYTAVVFIFTGVVAAIFTIFVVKYFPPASAFHLQFLDQPNKVDISFSKLIVNLFTVSDFSKLLSHENILPLIIFSALVGLSVSRASEKGKSFMTFLQSGEDISMRFFSLIMYYAPIGFFSYFAVLVGGLGFRLIENYLHIALIYYVSSLLYFIVIFTSYAYLAGKMEGVKLFWKNIFLPMMTSVATCSSAASIPANLIATKGMRVSSEIYETTIPLGTMIHKDGSVIGGMLKIAFLFGIFHLSFSSVPVLLSAICISMLVGCVMGAIPSGGMMGELLILNVYGFPSSVLMAIAAISIIIDPPATMLNVTGNAVSSMMIARLVEGKKWLIRAP